MDIERVHKRNAYSPHQDVPKGHGRVDDLSAGDKNSFIETARLAGEASRQFAGAAEKNGVTELAQSGMEVVADVDRAKFAAAMAQANPVFAQQFGDDRIRQIREYR